MRAALSHVLIGIGICILFYAGYLVFERTNPSALSFATPPASYKPTGHHGIPMRIDINHVHIHLPLYPSTVRNNVWETTTLGASFLTTTPLPGDRGNSIIYAHNWTSLFGNLVSVHPGDKVEITYKNTPKKIFTIVYTDTVTPENVQILSSSQDNRITMYTCTGFFDMKRFVAVGVLQ